MNRRNFLHNAAGLLVAAPFVVKASTIMRVVPVEPALFHPGPFMWVDPLVHNSNHFLTPGIWAEVISKQGKVRRFMLEPEWQVQNVISTKPIEFMADSVEDIIRFRVVDTKNNRVLESRQVSASVIPGDTMIINDLQIKLG